MRYLFMILVQVVIMLGVMTSVTHASEVQGWVSGSRFGLEDQMLMSQIGEQEISGFIGFNFLKVMIRDAVVAGVPLSTIVILFLFPIVSLLVVFSRLVLGVSGFGILIPSILSVAFMSTGAWTGVIMLVFVMMTAILFRFVIKHWQIPYLSKLSILIFLVALSVFVFLTYGSTLGMIEIASVGIFPIILFLLLSETFVETQITRSMRTAFVMTVETVMIALVAYAIMSLGVIKSAVLLHPEIALSFVFLANYYVGRYDGLRLSEVWRFRKIIGAKK
jgi:hypothetical protein